MNNNMNHWAQAFEAMPEKQFFKIIRLYLGEVQTPYNKQRLISQLASFIKTPEHTNVIISFLDQKDISYLTAIFLIPNATQQMLLDFFSDTTASEVFSTLANLTERLLIYSTTEKYSDDVKYHINPLLLDSLRPYFSVDSIFTNHELKIRSTEDSFCISPNFLASFISYLSINKIGCKNDGTIKKTDFSRLQEIFAEKADCLQLIVNAFINLSILIEKERYFELNKGRLEQFAKLSQIEQYSFLCVASCCRFGREGLKKQVQILLTTINSIPQTGFSVKEILRLLVLSGTRTEEGTAFSGKSRFSQILEKTKALEENKKEDSSDNSFAVSKKTSQVNVSVLQTYIEVAISFGLIKELGTSINDKNGQTKIYVKNEQLELQQMQIIKKDAINQNFPRVLNIDSTFTVTLMPGLELQNLLPFTSFLAIKKSGVVTEFELTKQSVSVGFDEGWNPQSIFEELKKYSHFDLPQNLVINVQEWYKSYDAARLFFGYVLKVSDSNITIAENNPNIKKYIKEKLAEGVYLLNIPQNSEIKTFIKESGLDFLGKIQQAEQDYEFITFPTIQEKSSLFTRIDLCKTKEVNFSDAKNKIEDLKKVLENKELDEQQKESLLYKISNRLILSQNQLNTTSVRIEILEAEGIDFAGKIHLAESAIKDGDMMELTFPKANASDFFTIIGKPLNISKQVGEAILQLQIEPSKEVENFLVSKITHLRRLHF